MIDGGGRRKWKSEKLKSQNLQVRMPAREF